MANVTTGFSKPYVAKYANTTGTNVYTDGMLLARGVSVSVEADSVDDNNFYADNIIAESEKGNITGGTLTLTVDGLSTEAKKLILGLPNASGSWVAYGDEADPPYVGVGFIRRTMNLGSTSYWGVVFPKCKFTYFNEDAETSEEQINWQTLELEATFLRDDTTHHNWKMVSSSGYSTESAAEAAVKAYLSIT